MSGRGEAGGVRRAGFASGVGLVVLALLSFVVIAVAVVAGCGGSSPSGIGPYLGAWQRVEGGVPDPGLTLTVARQVDGCAVTFGSVVGGQSRTVAATVQDGFLACTLPAGDDAHAAAAAASSPGTAGAPAESDLQLSVDDNGQLVVDLVLADGTTEPVWVYERASSPAPVASPEP